jgi:hypothetical protein
MAESIDHVLGDKQMAAAVNEMAGLCHIGTEPTTFPTVVSRLHLQVLKPRGWTWSGSSAKRAAEIGSVFNPGVGKTCAPIWVQEKTLVAVGWW